MAERLTQLLVRWSDGDMAALDELMPLVYDQLRRIAKNYFRRERQGMTLQPTALVNEAYLRLVDHNAVNWQNRAHFYAISASLMREILVDHVRRRRALKRGGFQARVSLADVDQKSKPADIDLVALDDALRVLESERPQLCRIVELRYFTGLTIEETAEALKLSHSTVERGWALAKAWLHRELSR
ncbi:MAG: sigma-70 family RNA polymerase sigma factor [Blastocatellia bacterium]